MIAFHVHVKFVELVVVTGTKKTKNEIDLPQKLVCGTNVEF